MPRANFGMRNFSDITDREDWGVEGAVDVTVELDVDAADKPKDTGVVIVEVLDFLSDDREGGGNDGIGETASRKKSSRPRLMLRVCGLA